MKNKAMRLALVLLVAVMARGGFCYLQSRTDPLFLYPVMDEITYQREARQLAESSFSVSGMKLPFLEPPGYIFSLALLLACGISFSGIIIIQSVLGVASACLVYWIVDRLTEQKHPWLAVAAGLFFSLCPAMLYYETKYLRPSWSIFLLLVLFLLTSFRPRWWTLALAGLTAGLLCLFEAYFLLLAGACIVFFWYKGRIRMLVFVAFFLLVIIPVTVLNASSCGKLVPVSVNGGINLYVGNNADWKTTYNMLPGWQWRQLSYRYFNIHGKHGSLGIALSGPHFTREVLNYMTKRPLSFLSGLATKCGVFFSCREITRDNYWSYPFPINGWACLYNGIIIILLFMCVPGLYRQNPLLLSGLVIMVAVNTVFFPSTRYRLPLIPLTLVSVSVLASMTFTRTMKVVALCAAILTLAAGLLVEQVVDYTGWKALRLTDIGSKLLVEGNRDQGEAFLQRSLDLRVTPKVLSLLAWYEAGLNQDYRQAVRYLEHYIKLEPQHPYPYFLLADYERLEASPDLSRIYSFYRHYHILRDRCGIQDVYRSRCLQRALEFCREYEERRSLEADARQTHRRLEVFWDTIREHLKQSGQGQAVQGSLEEF